MYEASYDLVQLNKYDFFHFQRRIDAKRNGFLPCIKHKKWKPVECSQRDICKSIFKQLGKALTKPPVKIFVLLFTAALAGLGQDHLFTSLAG